MTALLVQLQPAATQNLKTRIRRAVGRRGLEATLAAQEAHCLLEVAEEELLGDLLRRCPVVRIRSRLLGEEVLLAAEGAQVPAGSALVVYRESELPQVIGRPPEEVKAIHAVKKALDGQVEAPGRPA